MMNLVLGFLLGFFLQMAIWSYRVNKVMLQLEKVSKTGDPMFRNGVVYSLMQIEKEL